MQMGIGEPTRYWASATNRAGSYAMNWYLMNASWYQHDQNQPRTAVNRKGDFLTENQVQRPILTPVVADAVWWRVSPSATDYPPSDLTTGASSGPGGEMSMMAIPRHGSRPNRLLNPWPQKQLLPGAVNVAFYDGHGETVKLERLWQLYWHADYKPPAKRPGL
jgi:prepilin-type processing-associated H-X9-DG protein